MLDELLLGSAARLAAAVRERKVGSRELLDGYLQRIERLNAPLNAVVTLDAERAMQRARELDDRLARGEPPLGPLHGLPLTIKDAYETAGIRSTGGAREYAQHVPTRNATAVQRLIDAGAVVFGKTNVPAYSGDVQSYNDVFGTTNNPFDRSRTPAGSSGGAAVWVACGFTALELGSDIGGSIPTPAHWTGIYGHKPTHGIVPQRGHIPGPPGTLAESDLSVCGPLARDAGDLSLALSLLAGPDEAHARAWRLALPRPRRERLADYRIAAWLDDPAAPVDAEVRDLLERAVAALRAAGAQVDDEARPDLTLAEVVDTYGRLLDPVMVAGMPKPVHDMLIQTAEAATPPDRPEERFTRFARNAMARHVHWLRAHERRARYGARLAAFFERYDVLLCPVNGVPAIPHDHAGSQLTRVITVNGQQRPYMDLLAWVAIATTAHLPATVAPIGRTAGGLPVGIQIVGPYLEDLTPIDVAARMAEVIGGFAPPPCAAP
jgi:amidase